MAAHDSWEDAFDAGVSETSACYSFRRSIFFRPVYGMKRIFQRIIISRDFSVPQLNTQSNQAFDKPLAPSGPPGAQAANPPDDDWLPSKAPLRPRRDITTAASINHSSTSRSPQVSEPLKLRILKRDPSASTPAAAPPPPPTVSVCRTHTR